MRTLSTEYERGLEERARNRVRRADYEVSRLSLLMITTHEILLAARDRLDGLRRML